jgi:hypothetical protein
MERMTKRENGHVHYPRCFEEPCGGMGCRTEDCEVKVEIRERLAAYEDTGLEPEEVLPKDKADEIALKLMRLADLESLCNYTRLRELAEADKDGRLVVLPCKVGDTVYRIVRDADPHIARDEARNMYFADDMTLCVELVGGRIILSEKFGKTVFLTREAAEKALEAMKDE